VAQKKQYYKEGNPMKELATKAQRQEKKYFRVLYSWWLKKSNITKKELQLKN